MSTRTPLSPFITDARRKSARKMDKEPDTVREFTMSFFAIRENAVKERQHVEEPSEPTHDQTTARHGPTQRMLILRAALLLEQEMGEPRRSFTAADLVVRAWTLNPLAFGLHGYEQKHPDSNRVLSKVMGARGLVYNGLLRPCGIKRYAMTEAGRRALAKLDKESR